VTRKFKSSSHLIFLFFRCRCRQTQSSLFLVLPLLPASVSRIHV
jgi:hypothetical protein